MKRTLLFILLSLIILPIIASADEVLTLTPASPKRGDVVTATYHAGLPSAKIGTPSAPELLALVVNDDNTLMLIEAALKNKGTDWTGSFTLDAAKGSMVMFKVVDGEKTDDNDGTFWDVLVSKGDGTPVLSAHANRAASFAFGGYPGFRRGKDPVIAKQELELEAKLYPDNWRASVVTWNMTMAEGPSPEALQRLHGDVVAVAGKFASDDEAYASTITFLEQTGDSARAKEIRSAILSRNPKGPVAKRWKLADASREKDPAKRSAMLETVLSEFSILDPSERGAIAARLVGAYAQQKSFEKMANVLKVIPEASASTYNQVAFTLMQEPGMLDAAVAWAKRGVDVARNPDPGLKSPSARVADWKEENAYYLAMILDTYGLALLKQEKPEEAVLQCAEAYKLTKGEETELNENYITALVAAKNYDTALEVGTACIRAGNATDGMQSAMKTAYAKKAQIDTFDGLDDGKKKAFDAMIADARAAMKLDLVRKLQESRLHQPSIDFTLPRLDGDPVTLSALKGKVVVIDFWATWCGPCRSSFPYLQKVYEKFRNNPDVMILAVNTWERVKEKQAIIENARKFMTDNKYSFPVLLDNTAVSDYDVEGIPTKFIIDREGKIAFKEVGFNGPKMEDELSTQIEMLLAEKSGSAK